MIALDSDNQLVRLPRSIPQVDGRKGGVMSTTVIRGVLVCVSIVAVTGCSHY